MPHLEKTNISNRVQLSLGWKKKEIVIQILLSKPLYIGQIYTTPKLIKEEIENTIAQLSIWTSYFRHRYSTKLSRTSMDLKIIKPHQCFLERKGLMLYWLNLKNNYNRGLCLFRQKQIFRSSRNKNLQNQNNENLHHHIRLFFTN